MIIAQAMPVSMLLPEAKKKAYIFSTLTMALISLYAYWGIAEMNPPRAVPDDVAATEFSSGRALKHLRAISQHPHPSGSAEHDLIRDYLLAELRAEGVGVDVQKATALTSGEPPIFAGTVENLIGRLKGTGGGKAIMLVSHYDSVPGSPGASDDGAGIAAMLECLRVLNASPALKNDVVFLFTDGEESGLLGARAFVDGLATSNEVGLVLNFEARGSRGPSLMFETSPGNDRIIREFAKAAPYPVASSLFNEVYRVLPNDTDMSIFNRHGIPGLNFAYIEGIVHYHTRQDNIASMDERSLQHHGSYAVALARHFGTLDLEVIKGEDAVYFNFVGSIFVHYSTFWARVLMVLVIIVFLAVISLGFRRRSLTAWGMLAGAGALLINMIIGPLLVSGIWRMICAIRGWSGITAFEITDRGSYYVLSFTALTIAISASLYLGLAKKFTVESLAAGASSWWILLLVVTTLFLPGTSYLIAWPLLFSLPGLGYVIYIKDKGSVSTRRFIGLAATAMPAVALLSPTIDIVSTALRLNSVWIPMVLVALLAGLLIPQIGVIGQPSKLLLPVLSVLITLCLVLAAGFGPGFDAANPRPNHIFYDLDSDRREAFWASADQEPDEWTSQFFPHPASREAMPALFPFSPTTCLKSGAPTAPLLPPEIKLLGDMTVDGVRRLSLRVVSQRQAPILMLRFDSRVDLLGVSIDGKSFIQGRRPLVFTPDQPWLLQYHAPPKEGVDIALDIKGPQSISMTAIDRSYGFPRIEGFSFRERPETMMPSPLFYSDSTFVTKAFAF